MGRALEARSPTPTETNTQRREQHYVGASQAASARSIYSPRRFPPHAQFHLSAGRGGKERERRKGDKNGLTHNAPGETSDGQAGADAPRNTNGSHDILKHARGAAAVGATPPRAPIRAGSVGCSPASRPRPSAPSRYFTPLLPILFPLPRPAALLPPHPKIYHHTHHTEITIYLLSL